MKYSRMTSEQALLCKSGVDLDVFVWEFVMDGFTTLAVDASGNRVPMNLPSFSRRPEAMKMLMIKMFAENPGMEFTVSFGPEYFDDAKREGMVIRDNQIPVWHVRASLPLRAFVSYGASLEEAVCKMAILLQLYNDANA